MLNFTAAVTGVHAMWPLHLVSLIKLCTVGKDYSLNAYVNAVFIVMERSTLAWIICSFKVKAGYLPTDVRLLSLPSTITRTLCLK